MLAATPSARRLCLWTVAWFGNSARTAGNPSWWIGRARAWRGRGVGVGRLGVWLGWMEAGPTGVRSRLAWFGRFDAYAQTHAHALREYVLVRARRRQREQSCCCRLPAAAVFHPNPSGLAGANSQRPTGSEGMSGRWSGVAVCGLGWWPSTPRLRVGFGFVPFPLCSSDLSDGRACVRLQCSALLDACHAMPSMPSHSHSLSPWLSHSQQPIRLSSLQTRCPLPPFPPPPSPCPSHSAALLHTDSRLPVRASLSLSLSRGVRCCSCSCSCSCSCNTPPRAFPPALACLLALLALPNLTILATLTLAACTLLPAKHRADRISTRHP